MCKKLIINSGIKKVVIRIGEDKIKVVDVEDWIINDDSLFISL
jgi:dCMP deaminase